MHHTKIIKTALFFCISLTSTTGLNVFYNSLAQKNTTYHHPFHYKGQTTKNNSTPTPHNLSTPVITYLLLGITIIVSMTGFANPDLIKKYATNAKLVYNNPKKEWHRCITAGFVHSSWMHLLFNIITLYQLGTTIEPTYASRWKYGSILYLLLYLGSISAGSTAYVLMYKDENKSAKGAAAGTFGLIATDILLNPLQKIYGLPKWIFESLCALASSYLMPTITGRKVAYISHLGGALFGILLNIIFDPTLLVRFYNYLLSSKPKESPQHPSIYQQKRNKTVFY